MDLSYGFGNPDFMAWSLSYRFRSGFGRLRRCVIDLKVDLDACTVAFWIWQWIFPDSVQFLTCHCAPDHTKSMMMSGVLVVYKLSRPYCSKT